MRPELAAVPARKVARMAVKVRQGCTPACYYARARGCDCACGGANHQRGYTKSGGVTRVIAMNDGFYKLNDVGNESDSIPAAGGIPPEAMAKLAEEVAKSDQYRRFQDRHDGSLADSAAAHDEIGGNFDGAADRLEGEGERSMAARARARAQDEHQMADDRYEELNQRAHAAADRPAAGTQDAGSADYHRQRAEKLRADEARHRADIQRQAEAGRPYKADMAEQMADEAAAQAAIHERHAGIEPAREPGTATRMENEAQQLAVQAARVRQERDRREKRKAEIREADRQAREAAAEVAANRAQYSDEDRARIEAVVAAQRANGAAAHMAAQTIMRRDALAGDKGINATYKVTLADGTVGYQKPAGEAHGAGESTYDAKPIEQVTHEAAAYHLSQVMGQGYAGLVPTTVMVDDPELGIASIQEHAGTDSFYRKDDDRPWEHQIHEDQLRHAALFDAVMGHQDRHQFNWRVTTLDRSHKRSVVLIDNGYAFQKGGHLNASGFVDWRYKGGDERTRLDESERAVLSKLSNSSDLGGIAPMIGEQRAQAMRDRIEFMLDEGRIMDQSEILMVSRREDAYAVY